jgi:hypothetical protein
MGCRRCSRHPRQPHKIHPFIFFRASDVSGIFSQNISASVSFAITACCVSFVSAPRRIVRWGHTPSLAVAYNTSGG